MEGEAPAEPCRPLRLGGSLALPRVTAKRRSISTSPPLPTVSSHAGVSRPARGWRLARAARPYRARMGRTERPAPTLAGRAMSRSRQQPSVCWSSPVASRPATGPVTGRGSARRSDANDPGTAGPRPRAPLLRRRRRFGPAAFRPPRPNRPLTPAPRAVRPRGCRRDAWVLTGWRLGLAGCRSAAERAVVRPLPDDAPPMTYAGWPAPGSASRPRARSTSTTGPTSTTRPGACPRSARFLHQSRVPADRGRSGFAGRCTRPAGRVAPNGRARRNQFGQRHAATHPRAGAQLRSGG